MSDFEHVIMLEIFVGYFFFKTFEILYCPLDIATFFFFEDLDLTVIEETHS